MTRKPLCEQYDPASVRHANELGDYFAVVDVESLPRRRHSESQVVSHGYAVAVGSWFFLPALAPAVALGRAARMSDNCMGYRIQKAATHRQFCPRHEVDEVVLLLLPPRPEDRDHAAQVGQLELFVQAVRENPRSSHWHQPTGAVRRPTSGAGGGRGREPGE